MSTFYATFKSAQDARDLVQELLRAGVKPDDLSLITKQALESVRTENGMAETGGRTGDATVLVGRDDDPVSDDLIPSGPDVTDKMMNTASPIMGIDTSNKSTNVEMVDQSDDSQTYAESSIQPDNEISQAEHERDDLELAIHTGFPTAVPVIEDNVRDTETPIQDQLTQGVETIVVPGAGTAIGGGALATAALDFINPNGSSAAEALVNHLKDEGMDEERAKQYAAGFYNGMAILAVHTNPGDLDQGLLEEYVSRHSVMESDLVDAPRFYEGGGRASMR